MPAWWLSHTSSEPNMVSTSEQLATCVGDGLTLGVKEMVPLKDAVTVPVGVSVRVWEGGGRDTEIVPVIDSL